jgi:hypothetical protein
MLASRRAPYATHEAMVSMPISPQQYGVIGPAVVDLLKVHTCLPTEYEYPGTISVTLDDDSFVNFGMNITSNGWEWYGSRFRGDQGDDYHDDPLDWSLPSVSADCADPEVIARAIALKFGAPWVERPSAEIDTGVSGRMEAGTPVTRDGPLHYRSMHRRRS